MDTFCWPISDIHEDNRLVSYIFVNGLPESRLFKITFPESRFVKSPNPVSRSKLQSRISLPFSSKIPNPGLQISQIPNPEKPIGDPQCSFSALLDAVTACGVSSDHPRPKCTRDIWRHRQLHGLSGDNALDSEYRLLLAKAGNALLILDISIIVILSSILPGFWCRKGNERKREPRAGPCGNRALLSLLVHVACP